MGRAKPGRHLTVREIGPHEWEFEYSRLDGRVYDSFHETLELFDRDPARAIPPLRKLIGTFPEFIDARHHLAIALADKGDLEGAELQWEAAVRTGWEVLPDKFCIGRDRLEWGWLDNRPFLRAYHGLALARLDEGLVGEAVSIFQNLLDLNPNDNQGARETAVGCYFTLRRPADVLRVCERYPGAGPSVLYGRGLALFQLGEEAEARAALVEAVGAYPLVAKELLKRRHVPPKQEFPGFVTVGGADEAYSYWTADGEHWERTRGALSFLRSIAGPASKAGK